MLTSYQYQPASLSYYDGYDDHTALLVSFDKKDDVTFTDLCTISKARLACKWSTNPFKVWGRCPLFDFYISSHPWDSMNSVSNNIDLLQMRNNAFSMANIRKYNYSFSVLLQPSLKSLKTLFYKMAHVISFM